MNIHRSHLSTETDHAAKSALILALAAFFTLAGCAEEPLFQYSNLDGPNSASNVRGDVCITTNVENGVIVGNTYKCQAGERGNITLFTNGNSNSLVIMDLYPGKYNGQLNESAIQPRFFDANPMVPGVTHLPVGQFPVSSAASPKGRAVYTLNQISRSISTVDLLNLTTVAPDIPLPGIPNAFDTTTDGQIITTYADQPLLTVHQGSTCANDTPTGCSVNKDVVASVKLVGYPTDLALAKSVKNKARISKKLFNNNNLAYVSYRDKPVISVIALDAAALAATNGTCNGAAAPPCRIAEIPLTYGCNDGLDNDGDGLIDKDDPQCLNPYGAEGGTAAGSGIVGGANDPGRDTPTECNDGVDNDGDGKIDKDDPDCIASGGKSESNPPAKPPTTACNDGIDNDGDGKVDDQAPGCYFPGSKSEKLPPSLGYNRIAIDSTGSILWVLDRAHSQVLIVDATRQRLIDAPKSVEPKPEKGKNLGIRVPETLMSVTAATRQSVVKGSEERSLVSFSAFVGSDNGFVYSLDAFELSCSSKDPSDCVVIPEFPLAAPDSLKNNAATCTAPPTLSCGCEPDAQSCVCDKLPNDAQDFLKQHLLCTQNAQVLVTPIFSVGDAGTSYADVPTIGQCSLPETVVQKAVSYSQDHAVAAANPASCDSVLIPQPRALDVPKTVDAQGKKVDAGKVSIAQTKRATLTETYIPFFRSDVSGNDAKGKVSIVAKPLAREIQNDRWTVTYQGVLPRTERTTWFLPNKTQTEMINGKQETVAVVATPTNLCTADVRAGDYFEVVLAPTNNAGNCRAFEGPQKNRRYEIVTVTPQALTIKTTGSDAAPLPTLDTGCFSSTVSAVVRGKEVWVINREGKVTYSAQKSENGACVPSEISETENDRVETGGVYNGPGISFKVYEGFVTPDEDLEYIFDVQSNYQPLNFRPRESTGQASVGNLPYSLYFNDYGPDDLAVFFLTDPTANLIWANLTLPVQGSGRNALRSTFRFVIR